MSQEFTGLSIEPHHIGLGTSPDHPSLNNSATIDI